MAKPGAQFDKDIADIKATLAKHENRIAALESNTQVPDPDPVVAVIGGEENGEPDVLINATVSGPSEPPADPETTRPYGPNAPWNVPVSGLTHNAIESTEISRLVSLDTGFNWNFRQKEYTYPVYHTSDATVNWTVNALYSESGLNGSTIPFNPAWQAGPGTDAQMIILNTATGEEYNIWKYDSVVSLANSEIVASRINRVQGDDQGAGTGYDSYFTREVGYKPARGIGIQYLMGLVRPWEIAQGVIEHAMSMPVIAPNNEGAFAPATKIEGIQDSGPVREGLRFSLEVSEAEIDAHLAAMPGDVSTAMRASMKVLFTAMRDYGWFITDNSGALGLQLENDQSADWASVDMVDFTSSGGKTYPRDAMDGLVTQARLRCYVDSKDASYPAFTPSQAASFTDPDLGTGTTS